MTRIRPTTKRDKARCEGCGNSTDIVIENLQGKTMFLCVCCMATAFSEHPKLMALVVSKLLLRHGLVELKY